jgi:hypothetical protein
MNLLPWPKEWTGSGAVAAWMKRLLNRCKQEVFLESKDFRRVQTNGGYFIEAKARASGGGKTSSSNPVKYLAITQLGSSLIPPLPDLLICRVYSPGISFFPGPDIYVAKQLQMRSDISKEFFYDNGDNVTQTYTAFTKTVSDASYGDNFRLATDGVNTELQVVDPRYITANTLPAHFPIDQCLIYALETGLPTGVLDPAGNPVTLVEFPMREWGRFSTQ